jgi:DNA replication and repair protein RecF
MWVETLAVRDFRLYADTTVGLTQGITVLYGANGAGKSSLIEALCIAAWGRSLRTHTDSVLVRHGAQGYCVRVRALSDVHAPYWVEVRYELRGGKAIESTEGKGLSPKDLVGRLPLVLLSPELREITSGAPQERRRFLDILLAQSTRLYAELLVEHRQLLRQRNLLLAQYAQRADPALLPQLESWTDRFIQVGAELIWRRRQFVEEFQPLVCRYYERIAPERLQLRYLPDGAAAEELPRELGGVVEWLRARARTCACEELRRGSSLFGPQRDELQLLLNGAPVREVASQGQHKSVLISLKLAELEYLAERRSETPVLALDDLFAELDEGRARQVLELVRERTVQTLITLTEPERLPLLRDHASALHWLRVERGTVAPAAPKLL